MNNLRKLFGIIFIAAIIMCAMAACELFSEQTQNQTPVAGDYEIGNLIQTSGSTIVAVTVKPKTGKSPGAVTVYYEGIGGTVYTKSPTVPTAGAASSIYAVTFDVAAATGWNAGTGLYAGTLVHGTQTPVADDYNITGLFQTGDNTAKTVTITPKEGKSSGARTIYYEGTGGTAYAKNTTGPSANGSYTVTFDVAAVSGWKAAAGLSAGTLVINNLKTPKETDYTFANLTQKANSVTAVTVTPKNSDASSGEITIYYEGVDGTNYSKSATIPQAAGNYAVTFDVAAVESLWNPAKNLSAGKLVVTASTAQSISVTILGEKLSVRNELTADVQKNFSGTVTYQWLKNGSEIPYETDQSLWLNLGYAGQKISVKVKCDGKEAVSEPVTIDPLPSYTASVYKTINYDYEDSNYRHILSANVQVDGFSYDENASEENGFSCKWYRGSTLIPGVTGHIYPLSKDDAGKTIKVIVNGHSRTAEASYQISSTTPSNLSGTWTANLKTDGGYDEDNEWHDEYTTNYIFTLRFTTSITWTMDLDCEVIDTNDVEVYKNEESIEGTYYIPGWNNNYVYLWDDNGNSLENGYINGSTSLTIGELTFNKS